MNSMYVCKLSRYMCVEGKNGKRYIQTEFVNKYGYKEKYNRNF